MEIPVDRSRAYAIRPTMRSRNTRMSYHAKSACCVLEQNDGNPRGSVKGVCNTPLHAVTQYTDFVFGVQSRSLRAKRRDEMDGKKLRILMLNYEFPPLGGGGGIAAYKLAKGLVEMGHRVDCVTTRFDGLKAYEVVEGIGVYRVDVVGRRELPTATMSSLLSYPFLAYPTCLSLFEKNDYDVIHSHFAVPTGPLGVWLSERFQKPHILSLHGGDLYDPSKKTSPHETWYFRAAVRWVLERASALVAQSSNTKAHAAIYYGQTRPIHVIPLPYQPIPFERVSREALQMSREKKYVIGIGRLVKRKAFEDFVRVVARLPEDVVGLIVGEGPEKEPLQRLAKEQGVSERIRLLGFVSQEQKFQYLAQSDVFLLTSLHEGFGIVLQEAMQVGLPLVATNHGGQVDVIEEGKNGYLVGVGDVESMAERIRMLLAQPEVSDVIREYNQKDIQTYDAIKIAERYEGIFLQALSAKQGGGRR